MSEAWIRHRDILMVYMMRLDDVEKRIVETKNVERILHLEKVREKLKRLCAITDATLMSLHIFPSFP